MKRLLAGLALLACAPWPAGARAFGLGPEFSLSNRSFDLVDRFITQARFRLDAEVYHLTDKKIIKALQAAAARGVEVRLILDPGQARNWQSARSLQQQPHLQARWMLTDASRGQLMHAKCACADNIRVLVGSANWTYSGLNLNHEAEIALEDASLALDFTAAFERDWQAASPAWPRRRQSDEEMQSLPDAGQYFDDTPRYKKRHSGL